MYIPVPQHMFHHVCAGCCFAAGISCNIREMWDHPTPYADAVSVCDQRLTEQGIPPSSVNLYHWAKVTDSAAQLPE